jgi:hypothetical protein
MQAFKSAVLGPLEGAKKGGGIRLCYLLDVK